ncbi:MAG: helix-turn-helix domain-containing protein, partial [Geodermatophilaceae bacterium]
MLSVENWAEIRRVHRAEGMPIKAIARVMGVSRNTVRAALRSDGPARSCPLWWREPPTMPVR